MSHAVYKGLIRHAVLFIQPKSCRLHFLQLLNAPPELIVGKVVAQVIVQDEFLQFKLVSASVRSLTATLMNRIARFPAALSRNFGERHHLKGVRCASWCNYAATILAQVTA